MSGLPLYFYSDQLDHAPLKVSVFAKIEEMRQVGMYLSQISELKTPAKKKWLDDHAERLHEMLEKFTKHISLEIEKSKLDGEMMKLLSEYTIQLQQLTSTVQSMYTALEGKRPR